VLSPQRGHAAKLFFFAISHSPFVFAAVEAGAPVDLHTSTHASQCQPAFSPSPYSIAFIREPRGQGFSQPEHGGSLPCAVI
jgi:hypothetical protein